MEFKIVQSLPRFLPVHLRDRWPSELYEWVWLPDDGRKPCSPYWKAKAGCYINQKNGSPFSALLWKSLHSGPQLTHYPKGTQTHNIQNIASRIHTNTHNIHNTQFRRHNKTYNIQNTPSRMHMYNYTQELSHQNAYKHTQHEKHNVPTCTRTHRRREYAVQNAHNRGPNQNSPSRIHRNTQNIRKTRTRIKTNTHNIQNTPTRIHTNTSTPHTPSIRKTNHRRSRMQTTHKTIPEDSHRAVQQAANQTPDHSTRTVQQADKHTPPRRPHILHN
jgi:hypothetical protein